MEDTNTSGTAICFAGDHAILTLSATTNFEPDSINSGQVLCRGGKVFSAFTFDFGLFVL